MITKQENPDQPITILYRIGADWAQEDIDVLKARIGPHVQCSGIYDKGSLGQATTPLFLIGDYKEDSIRSILGPEKPFVVEVREYKYMYMPFRELVRHAMEPGSNIREVSQYHMRPKAA